MAITPPTPEHGTPSARRGPIEPLQARLVRGFLLIGGAMVALLLAVGLGLSGRMVDATREREAQRAWDRIAVVERAKAETLRTLVDGYAYSDTLAAFAEGGGDLRQIAFSAWALDNADVDGVLVLAADDAPRFAAVVERALPPLAAKGFSEPAAVPGGGASTGFMPMPVALVDALARMPEAERVRTVGDSAIAWLPLRGGWFQVAIGAIGRRDAPPNGALVFLVRHIDADRLAVRAIEAQLGYRIEAFSPARPAIVAGTGSARLAVPLEDPVGGVTAMAVADAPFELTAVLRQIQLVMVMQQALLLAAALGVLLWLLKRQVIDRIALLQRGVDALRHGAASVVALPGPRDELALLGEDFDSLYRSLDGARTDWRKAALRDPLTGLGNRAALQARLDLLLSAGRRWPATLHLLDLDGFKAVNDVHGHATGDALLISLAAALVARMGERAEVFRLGGDEYALLATHGGDVAAEVLDAVAAVRAPEVGGNAAPLRASLGRATIDDALRSPGDWLRRADIAMYAAKRAGGGRVVDFEPSMHDAAVERESIERRLRRALAEGGIDVAFQPIVAAADGGLIAVEALARWHDAERGRVPPSRFVPVAEEAGLSAELDMLVLDKALPALVALRERVPHALLQVNLAPPSLLKAGLVDRIGARLGDAGLGAEALVLEVTESALAADPAAAVAVVARLRALGLRIALDDFGTGYSSMARLAELKPSALKIDGQFVRDHEGDGDRIIRSILGLAKAFDLHATAEFVETEAQKEYLRAIGCDALQGYGIAEPMPLPQLLAWVDERRQRAP
ncbi:MAG TPA: hypothetical protein DCM32_00760 [Xanthomonadaceae bacterium]|jgi:diguanylate cyclase (GGDEF)-like protein|nr:hypothetical protein [Xanthomonadaceae bacterium]